MCRKIYKGRNVEWEMGAKKIDPLEQPLIVLRCASR
jgi:hypothetical protein